MTVPNRASNGPARRIDARIREQSAGSSGLGRTGRASIRTALGPVHSAPAPRSASSASIVSTSRMRGMFSSSSGPSARTLAARMGSAAFLLPAGLNRSAQRTSAAHEETWRHGQSWAGHEIASSAIEGVAVVASTRLFSRGAARLATRTSPCGEVSAVCTHSHCCRSLPRPTWVGPTIAISLAVIALSVLAAAVAAAVAATAPLRPGTEDRRRGGWTAGRRRRRRSRPPGSSRSRPRTSWYRCATKWAPLPRPAGGSGGRSSAGWTGSRAA